jgi:hypothetical protein
LISTEPDGSLFEAGRHMTSGFSFIPANSPNASFRIPRFLRVRNLVFDLIAAGDSAVAPT